MASTTRRTTRSARATRGAASGGGGATTRKSHALASSLGVINNSSSSVINTSNNRNHTHAVQASSTLSSFSTTTYQNSSRPLTGNHLDSRPGASVNTFGREASFFTTTSAIGSTASSDDSHHASSSWTAASAATATSHRFSSQLQQQRHVHQPRRPPAKAWVRVERPPRPHLPFRVSVWVPIDQLTVQELHDHQQHQAQQHQAQQQEWDRLAQEQELAHLRDEEEKKKMMMMPSLAATATVKPPPTPSITLASTMSNDDDVSFPSKPPPLQPQQQQQQPTSPNMHSQESQVGSFQKSSAVHENSGDAGSVTMPDAQPQLRDASASHEEKDARTSQTTTNTITTATTATAHGMLRQTDMTMPEDAATQTREQSVDVDNELELMDNHDGVEHGMTVVSLTADAATIISSSNDKDNIFGTLPFNDEARPEVDPAAIVTIAIQTTDRSSLKVESKNGMEGAEDDRVSTIAIINQEGRNADPPSPRKRARLDVP